MAAAVNIAGGGLAGGLLAVLLGRRGLAVRLFERRPDPRRHVAAAGRSINLALAARGIHALERAQLMDRVRPELLPMRGRMIHEPGALSAPHLLPYGQRAEEVIYSVGRAALNQVLITAAAELPNVELHFESLCTAVDPLANALSIQDLRSGEERTVGGAPTIATDGAGSQLRAALAHSGRLRVQELPLAHDYKELHVPARDGDFALARDALHVWPRHGFMLIALPNPDRSFTATLFLPRSGDPGFDRLGSDAAVLEFFQREFAEVMPLIPDLTAQFRSHPQGHLGTIHTAPWAVGSALLLGDAAHAIVPFHGQGMNAAFEDCLLLDMLIGEAGDPAQVQWPALFADFYTRRRADTQAIAQMALENYGEMRSAVLDERFLRHKAWSLQLERLYPGRFIPRYAMVMFHPQIPYAQALRRGAIQEQLLTELESVPAEPAAGEALEGARLSAAREWIEQRL